MLLIQSSGAEGREHTNSDLEDVMTCKHAFEHLLPYAHSDRTAHTNYTLTIRLISVYSHTTFQATGVTVPVKFKAYYATCASIELSYALY